MFDTMLPGVQVASATGPEPLPYSTPIKVSHSNHQSRMKGPERKATEVKGELRY